MSDWTRRDFVRHSSSVLAGISAFSIIPQSVRGANDKIRLGSIGLNSQGWGDTRAHMKTERVDVTALCDVDSAILEKRVSEMESAQGKKPKAYKDFRELLADPEVDAVIIGTPDHWHGIMAVDACKAGKDVYVEKPCAQTVHECRLIAKAAKKYNRIVQHGTQQRSAAHFQEAREYVQSGKLGKIALVRCWAALGRKSIGKKPATNPPANIDYDMWLGPAPKKPYTENRCHYNWRFMWDYGTGDMGNWGVHWIDIALWNMGLEWPKAESSSGGMFIFDDDKETPDTQLALYEYPNLTVAWELRMWSPYGFDGEDTGTAFYGEEQTLIVNRGGWRALSSDGKKMIAQGKPSDNMSVEHAKNFLDCIVSRKAPIADIANGHISAAVAVLGNVSYLADEKVRYDAEKETLDKTQFNSLLTRETRPEWPLPEV